MFQENFPHAVTREQNVHDFIKEIGPGQRKDLYTDLHHISSPCAFFSPAHTTAGKDDKANRDSLYTIGPLIKIRKARIVTLEQTYGILRAEKHHPHAFAVIKMLTSEGYSVRWRIFQLADFGLPARRERLMIVAAA